MKFWRSKYSIIFVILAALLCVGVMHAAEDMIPAEVLEDIKTEVKPTLIELLATSEFNTLQELKERLIRTSKVMKSFAEKRGTQLGLGESGSSTPTILPSTVPAIVTTPSVLPEIPTPTTEESSAEGEEIKPPAAIMPGAQEQAGETPEAIQPPAILAGPVAPTALVPVQEAEEAAESTAETPSLPSIPGLPALTQISETSAIPELPPLGGLSVPAATPITPVTPAPITMPGVPMPGAPVPALAPLAPLTPITPAPTTLSPAVPAPITPAPLTPPAMPAPLMPTGVPGLEPLPSLTYQELESLDSEMDVLMAMNIPQVEEPVQALDIIDNQSFELMTINTLPELDVDHSLDNLNLQDLTLAGLE